MLAWRRQRQVRASADILSDLMSAAPIGVAFLGREGHIARSNDEFGRIVSAGGGGEKSAGWFQALTGRAHSTNRTVIEPSFRFGVDRSRTAIASAFPTMLGGDGSRGGTGLLVLDTTEQLSTAAALHEAGHQFLAVADNIPQLAWTARPDGEIFWYDRRWFDYTGTTLDEMRGFGWREVHHPDDVERVTDGYKRAFANGEAWQDTFPLRGADGTFR